MAITAVKDAAKLMAAVIVCQQAKLTLCLKTLLKQR